MSSPQRKRSRSPKRGSSPWRGRDRSDAERARKRQDTTADRSPVRDKQEQRRSLVASGKELEDEPGTRRSTAARKAVDYEIDDTVPRDFSWGVAAINANLGNTSDRLKEFLGLVQDSDTCRFTVQVKDNDPTESGHGQTAVHLVGKGGETLLHEAFFNHPELIRTPSGFRVEVTTWARGTSQKVASATTLLHELELHTARAGQLVKALAGKGSAEDRFDLVLDYLRAPNDHLNLDGHERYIRSAARILGNSGTAEDAWARALFTSVCADATKHFDFEAREGRSTELMEWAIPALRWLKELQGAVASGGADATTKTPKPKPFRSASRRPDATRRFDQTTMLTDLCAATSKRTKLLDILDDARTGQGIPVSAVLDAYRDTVVPALYRQMPRDMTTVAQRLFFLTYHGVPEPVALALLARPTAPKEEVKVRPSWPPDLPMYWLTATEEGHWNYRDGLPRDMATTKDLRLSGNNEVLVNGRKYRAVLADAQPRPDRGGPKTTYHAGLKKWVTLMPRY